MIRNHQNPILIIKAPTLVSRQKGRFLSVAVFRLLYFRLQGLRDLDLEGYQKSVLYIYIYINKYIYIYISIYLYLYIYMHPSISLSLSQTCTLVC